MDKGTVESEHSAIAFTRLSEMLRDCVTLLLGIGAVVMANAAMVSVADPDVFETDLANSPVIGTAFPGVRLSAPAAGGTVIALGGGVTEVPGWAPAVFGHAWLNQYQCSGCWFMDGAPLRADFAASTSTVIVDFIDRYQGLAQVFAYDHRGDLIAMASDVLLGSAEPGEASRLRLEVSSKERGIAFVLAGAASTTYGVIDRIEWVTVPEPSSLVLIAVALALGGAVTAGRPLAPAKHSVLSDAA